MTSARKSTLEVVVPVAEFMDVDRGVSGHASRRGIARKRVLLLPSEKTSSIPFIDVLLGRMRSETPAAHVTTQRVDWAFFHPGRSAAIGAEIDRLASECDLMISGVAY
ncbi:MAG TPA: hypothetical protein VFY80_06315 [Burkholderiales bacterium]|jgi:hypothetical protein|nr:hypothetical protein [Burkholderiales bacterium]